MNVGLFVCILECTQTYIMYACIYIYIYKYIYIFLYAYKQTHIHEYL